MTTSKTEEKAKQAATITTPIIVILVIIVVQVFLPAMFDLIGSLALVGAGAFLGYLGGKHWRL